ncbi:caspase family protein [bacterium]|nr:caspase family protein [bacterium]
MSNAQNIRVLTDDPKNPLRPTRKAMEDNIAWLMSNVKAGDTLFFYYSGHGTRVKDSSGDETDGMDEVLVPLDYLRAGVITDDWLNANLVARVPSGATLYAFTDCCHSGTMCDLKYNVTCESSYTKGNPPRNGAYVPSDWTDKFSFTQERTADTGGTVILFSGCRDSQTSADVVIAGKGQGAFTSCFLDTIRSSLTPERRIRPRTVGDLLKEINCKLILGGYEQRSQLSVGKVQDINFRFSP